MSAQRCTAQSPRGAGCDLPSGHSEPHTSILWNPFFPNRIAFTHPWGEYAEEASA